MPKPKGSTKVAGRAKGTPNKATADARQAIASFVDGNAHRLTGWLDQVADGIPKAGEDWYWVAPNPAKAFEMFQSVVEYHIPKLARSEVKTEHSGEISLRPARPKLTREEWLASLKT